MLDVDVNRATALRVVAIGGDAAVVATRALKWLDARLDRFTPWRRSSLSMEGLQALSELAILLTRATSSASDPACVFVATVDVNRWRQFVLDQLVRPEVAELPRKRPLHCFPYILPYLVMRRTGYRDKYWEDTVAELQRLGFPFAQEVVPYRKLDVAYFMKYSGIAPQLDLSPFYRDTFLALRRNEIYVDDDSAYAVTHSLMYLSDFARVPPEGISVHELSAIRRFLESLAVTYWKRGHWDLLGEILLCMTMLPKEGRSVFPEALRDLFSCQAVDGGVVGRQANEGDLLSARRSDDEDKIFSACYHTTLVVALLSLRVLEHERTSI